MQHYKEIMKKKMEAQAQSVARAEMQRDDQTHICTFTAAHPLAPSALLSSSTSAPFNIGIALVGLRMIMMPYQIFLFDASDPNLMILYSFMYLWILHYWLLCHGCIVPFPAQHGKRRRCPL